MISSWRMASAVLLAGCLMTGSLTAQTTIDLEDAATRALFDGDAAGDSAGPFDIEGLSQATFTTTAVSGVIDTSSFGLGLNSGGSDPDTESFNIGEIWTVQSDVKIFLTALDIGGLQSEETFEIRSDAWINLGDVNPGNGVTFEASTGSFFLTDGPSSDIFTLTELTGGRLLPFLANTDVTFGNLQSTFGPNDDVELQSLTFVAIPEPSIGLLATGGLAILLVRRKRT